MLSRRRRRSGVERKSGRCQRVQREVEVGEVEA
jgi:hypothetical protein